jgi:glycosyltransferase involved in cell wall biosynthesis
MKRLRVAIVGIAEPLALETDSPTFRCGLLASALAEAGHDVVWWTSKFDHSTKQYHKLPETLRVSDNYTIEFLNGRSYKRNVSWGRILHNRDVARSLEVRLADAGAFDVFFVCVPIHELASVVLARAKLAGGVVVLDVRDPWPDYLLSVLPTPLHGVGRAVLRRSFREAEQNFRSANAITAVSETFLGFGLRYAGRAAGPDDGVFPIGYAIDRADPLPVRTESRGRVCCVFAGSFVVSADLPTVIKAARHLQDEGDDRFEFILVGDGPKMKRLRGMARGLNNLRMTGWLSRTALFEILTSADLGLVCYTAGAVQTLPNKPFEYWAAGLPIVESLGGELSTIVEEHDIGFSYEAGNAHSLMDALRRASAANIPAAGRRARKVIEDEFAADRIYPHLVKRLEAIAGVRE